MKVFSTICVTGHRTQHFNKNFDENDLTIKWVKKTLAKTVEFFIKNGTATFISGGAIGVDTWFAEIVLWYRDRGNYPNIELVIAKPFPSQDAVWNDYSKIRYQKICDRADSVEVLQPEPYAPWKLQFRNTWMIKKSDLCIAVLDSLKLISGDKSGTINCYKFAISRKVPIFHIDPYLKNVKLIKKDR